MRSIDESRAPNIFASDYPAFMELHYTMDSLYKQLHSDRVGSKKHSAQSFAKEDRDWEQGVMGARSPASLLRAVFYNGKDFCLRGGEENRSLRLVQFTRTENGYVYTENAIIKVESVKWGLNVEVRENRDAGEHCHCRLLDVYISKMPEDAKLKDLFYLHPLQKVKNEDACWCYSAPVGQNRLSKMVPEMCQLAGIPGRHTNHSLWATEATALYTTGVPEKIIQERSGHRSVECLRTHEHTNDQQ